MNKAKTLDPSGQAQSQGGTTPGPAKGKAAGDGLLKRGSDLGSQTSYKLGEDDNESPERDMSDAAKMDRITNEI